MGVLMATHCGCGMFAQAPPPLRLTLGGFALFLTRLPLPLSCRVFAQAPPSRPRSFHFRADIRGLRLGVFFVLRGGVGGGGFELEVAAEGDGVVAEAVFEGVGGLVEAAQGLALLAGSFVFEEVELLGLGV